jgi:subtilisin family serine protease
MARRAPCRNVKKTRSLETLESRVVMSADPLLSLHGSLIEDAPVMTTHSAPAMTTHVTPGYDPDADFWAGGGLLDGELNDLGERIEQTLYEANQQTGQNQMLAKYGFTGTGQTVAVIDTGIAYNHYALGGGVGSAYKVVGGWDFTENDWNFYDDQGPKAAHGTHVAGIIGAEGDGIHSGVSTGVDLVGLRVFDDVGNGYFHWVEQALQWVYTNRNSYANPITTVNLSLGTEWNSLSNPSWAMLENEFAQLESVGIFISVSAGNSFANYNTKGLSYPAASDYVIPVMATDGNGQLSYFSQRADGAIAAPGRYITSTVPDYAANDADTIDDDWLSMSGTSMAAPYVAGASTLIRQAMEFVGQTGVDQWDIYNHMMATADTFYDSATATNYKRLNLFAAIDALMPADDFASSQVDAYNLGTLNDSGATPLSNLSGVISTLDDADCFKFVAGASGTVTISATQSHELNAQWLVWGASNWTVNQAGECVIDVVAGQTYTFSIATSDGLGYYDLSVDLEASFAAIEWGSIGTQETRAGLSVNGETWYQVTAGRTGYFTAETIAQSGSASVAIYNAQMGALTSASARAEFQATAGQTFYLRVTGSSANFNLRMTNALTVSGGVASLVGTAGDDTLTFSAGASSHTVVLNSVSYTIASTSASTFQLDGGSSGYDRIYLNGGAGDDVAILNGSGGTLTGTGYVASCSNVDYAGVSGGGGFDRVDFNDTAGDNQITFRPGGNDAFMTGGAAFSYASGFERINAYATAGGFDTVNFYDTVGDDIVYYRPGQQDAYLNAAGIFSFAVGFERVNAYATAGGNDRVYFYDTASDDLIYFRPGQNDAYMTAGGVFSYASGFERVHAYATAGGYDRAHFYDTANADDIYFRPNESDAYMSAGGVFSYASGFERVDAYATAGGYDRVHFYDTAASDDIYFRPGQNDAYMTANGKFAYAIGFERMNAYATAGGYDRVHFYDTVGDDTVYMRPSENDAYVTANGFFCYAIGFERVNAYATAGGYDRVLFSGTAGADRFTARPATRDAFMYGTGYYNYATGFDSYEASGGSGGYDEAFLYDDSGNNQLVASGSTATLTATDAAFQAIGFDNVAAYSLAGGNDTVNEGTIDFVLNRSGAWV